MEWNGTAAAPSSNGGASVVRRGWRGKGGGKDTAEGQMGDKPSFNIHIPKFYRDLCHSNYPQRQ